MTTDIKELESLLSARMPIVAVESHEEQKVLLMLERFATLNERTLFVWSITRGLRRHPSGETAFNTQGIEEARAVYVEESLSRYVVALLRHTRANARLALGASPRAGIALLRVAKALAVAEGRAFLQPDDVKAIAGPVLAHRLILAPEARASGSVAEEVVQEAIEQTPVPI